MIKIYVKRIRTGLMKLEDVPMLWREQVKEIIESDNI